MGNKKIKKQVAVSAAAVIASLFAFSVSAADNGLSVYIDGEKLDFDVPPAIINDRTLVPMRAVFEALDADVEWNDETKTVEGKKDGTAISLQVGSDEMRVGGKTVLLDSPAVIRDGRTLVPIRAIAESLGVDVEWYDDIKTVAVITDGEIKYTELYNLNHEKKQIDSDFKDKYISLGWLESIEGLYTKMYSSTVEADIPIATLEENIAAGWGDEISPISLTSESTYNIDGSIMQLFWHPRNTSGKDITKYTITVYYLPEDSTSGYKKRSPTVSVTAKNDELLGITTTFKENCYIEITDMEDCDKVFIGEVSLRYKDGTTEEFWCGQEVTNGGEWSGNIYNNDFTVSENAGKGSVIYNIYSVDGKTDTVRYDEFLEMQSEGWYLTPVDLYYCSDGTVIIAAESCASDLEKDGLTTDIEDIMVKMYDNNGNIESFLPQNVADCKAAGWKLYTEPIKVLYSEDGSVMAVNESETDKYIKEGWHTDRSEVVITVYAPDERSMEILRKELDAYIAVGWSTEPMTTVYDSAGYGKAILMSEKDKYLSEGYYADLEPLYTTVYNPDGRSERILPYQAASYAADGWYSEPVARVYSVTGENIVRAKTELEGYLASGWALTPDDFYRYYYSLTGSVRGLKADEGAYIAGSWKMMPYPITINGTCSLERASVWSQYSYKLIWHPINTSGKTINSYRVEYYIPDGSEYYENYENFDISVEPGGELGHSEIDDSFLVSIPTGCDTVIIGDITVEYEDGVIETFWCGQTIKLGAEKWDGTIYNDKFELIPVEIINGEYVITPVGNTISQ